MVNLLAKECLTVVNGQEGGVNIVAYKTAIKYGGRTVAVIDAGKIHTARQASSAATCD